jgi:hypothetical protein
LTRRFNHDRKNLLLKFIQIPDAPGASLYRWGAPVAMGLQYQILQKKLLWGKWV